mmetsp:Transcript_25705/g.41291  ORF Transcript_25705/g.41291 Transcript_25705/m.41291 type:complete len:101 (+) Transcript_25705:88-390(+)
MENFYSETAFRKGLVLTLQKMVEDEHLDEDEANKLLKYFDEVLFELISNKIISAANSKAAVLKSYFLFFLIRAYIRVLRNLRVAVRRRLPYRVIYIPSKM